MYSKEQQLGASRIKAKKVSTFGKRKVIKKKRITNETELKMNNWLHEEAQMNHYKCFVCSKPVEEWHHIKRDSTDKKNHFQQLPLCRYHHTGDALSPHGTATLWRDTYSMEEQRNFANKIYIKFMERDNG